MTFRNQFARVRRAKWGGWGWRGTIRGAVAQRDVAVFEYLELVLFRDACRNWVLFTISVFWKFIQIVLKYSKLMAIEIARDAFIIIVIFF